MYIVCISYVFFFFYCFFFFKQKTAYEMRISDWSSDVCSSDLIGCIHDRFHSGAIARLRCAGMEQRHIIARREASISYGAMRTQIDSNDLPDVLCWLAYAAEKFHDRRYGLTHAGAYHGNGFAVVERSEEHTSELQSLMRISY